MRTINISEEGFKKFLAIKEARPQDASRAATFDHILYVYEEQRFKPQRVMGVEGKEFVQLGAIPQRINPANAASPIIDADKPRSAEELRAAQLSKFGGRS